MSCGPASSIPQRAAGFAPGWPVAVGEPDVVAAVAPSLLAACSIATLIAMALPWLLHRLGRDPAYGSGPLGCCAARGRLPAAVGAACETGVAS
jgi:Divalent cation transporter